MGPVRSTCGARRRPLDAKRIGRPQARQSRAACPAVTSGDQAASPDAWLCELTLAEGPHEDPQTGRQSATSRRASDKGLLPVTLDQYLELLEVSGRIVRDGKSGAIPAHLASILDRLQIKQTVWCELITQFQDWFGPIVGTAEQVAQQAAQVGRRWLGGASNCRKAFG